MEKFTLTKKDGHVIPVIWEVPSMCDRIVIMIHGFTSCKECNTGQLLLRRMPAEGIGVVCYDQPAHGKEEALEDDFRIENCMESLATVEQHVRKTFPGKEIVYLGSSYGAYLTGLYICQRPHLGTRLMMRSGAVIMPWLFLGTPDAEPDQESLAKLNEQGYLMLGLPGEPNVKVPKGMFEDMQKPENDLMGGFGNWNHGGTQVAMVHGAKDQIIPVQCAQQFAEKYNIPLTVFEGQGHSLGDDPTCPDKVADAAIAFYKGV